LPILKRSLIFTRPDQKWESPDIYSTWGNDFMLQLLVPKESLTNAILIKEFKHPFTQ
jgi:hypothetical protein